MLSTGEVSKDGHTPLSIAAEFGQLKAVQYLINVQKCNPKGEGILSVVFLESVASGAKWKIIGGQGYSATCGVIKGQGILD